MKLIHTTEVFEDSGLMGFRGTFGDKFLSFGGSFLKLWPVCNFGAQMHSCFFYIRSAQKIRLSQTSWISVLSSSQSLIHTRLMSMKYREIQICWYGQWMVLFESLILVDFLSYSLNRLAYKSINIGKRLVSRVSLCTLLCCIFGI